MTPSFKARLALLIAEFFYCGRFPVAPGTAGSLGALIIWVPALYYAPTWLILLLIFILFFTGIWASKYGIEYYNKADPKQVVIDEVAGIGIVFLFISPSLLEIIGAFILFRFFDIIKPWPIKTCEKIFPGAWGIMIDDTIAGIFAALSLVGLKYALWH